MVVSSALMIWKGLIVVTGCESPVVVVLTGSMEPAFQKGDLLLLTHDREQPIRVGDITVFKIHGRPIPIVHRVIKVHETYVACQFYPGIFFQIVINTYSESGEVKFLTKGDNNNVDDRALYAEGQEWLTKDDVMGRASAYLPYVGMITILMNENPMAKVRTYYANTQSL